MQAEQLEMREKKMDEMNAMIENLKKEAEKPPEPEVKTTKEETPPKRVKLVDETFVVNGKVKREAFMSNFNGFTFCFLGKYNGYAHHRR